MSSKPITLTSPGTDRPCVCTVRMKPSAMMSFASTTAVGAFERLIFSHFLAYAAPSSTW
jgi:hypothetical protein